MERWLADSPRLTAVLGPTNTGKTYLAVERMLTYQTGVIGFPLRLLAREVYDRVVRLKGERSVALVTGEEKRIPPEARYWLCTVESMPLDLAPDFLAVDEIQLAADRERGHVFTDRLLHARGARETMFLGAETIRPRLRALVPEADYLARTRFSDLRYLGEKKLSRLPPRSAVIAFSAEGVYRIAETMRATRGGAAVVLGALSPRTRNAQVALYQSGEVDYLVATDAIGMGLNMDLEQIWFSATRKFDGHGPRALGSAELAQIAGRAGRYLCNGGFGTTAGLGPLEPALVEAIENHRFPPARALYWRNSALDFSTLSALIASLEVAAPAPGLIRMSDTDDQRTLLALAADEEIKPIARGRTMVRLLWDVCQIPDFRKTLADAHVRLAREIFLRLAGSGRLANDWAGEQIARLDRTDGDIDTLTARISHIRTWTYIAYRPGWLDDARGWQERTRAIEDRLSDALHDRLTQRFIDRRATLFLRGTGPRGTLTAAVADDGRVMLEDHAIGHLQGFRFVPDGGAEDAASLRQMAGRTLEAEIATRLKALEADDDDAFGLALQERAAPPGSVLWRGASVARLIAGDSLLRPRLQLVCADLLNGTERERLRRRLGTWLERAIAHFTAPLAGLGTEESSAALRGLAFQLGETLGFMRRKQAADQLARLTPKERALLQKRGVRCGRLAVYVAPMLKHQRAAWRALLWSLARGLEAPAVLPPQGRVSLPRDPAIAEEHYLALGFLPLGSRAVRIDIAERLAGQLARRAKAGPFVPDDGVAALAGCKRRDLPALLGALGYQPCPELAAGHYAKHARPKRLPARPAARPRRAEPDPHSPFASLRGLALGAGGD
jgi:ATP-dependent RNA helicase SUPV3L1/SUV3